MYDLHVHSTASDGILTPEEIIDKAINIGLEGIAITDHDTVDGLASAEKYNMENKNDLWFITGIELNTEYEEDEVHILGYFIDYNNESLVKRLVEIRQERFERARKMVDKLRNMGFNISFERVKRLAQGDLIGRPHIAQALAEVGYVFSIKEAFDKYIGKGRPGYIPRYKFEPEEAIALINGAGGIAVLAHPGLIKDQKKIMDIIAMGVEGLEVYYPEHSENQIASYLNLCKLKGLLITGGSDFHGTGSGEDKGKMGCTGIEKDLVLKLKEFHEKKYKR
ncbi:PHP domain-containing protein [Thermosyntropha sp.]|uniref:PHP domain-containing protein n=1 Tax=Thermosyntropha sp. TaxID=2740820 RepID=UPI0025DFD684|nr:PHP domain-containing protein [Thermosyntropha sp.]